MGSARAVMRLTTPPTLGRLLEVRGMTGGILAQLLSLLAQPRMIFQYSRSPLLAIHRPVLMTTNTLRQFKSMLECLPRKEWILQMMSNPTERLKEAHPRRIRACCGYLVQLHAFLSSDL